jgi:hypothetical protein
MLFLLMTLLFALRLAVEEEQDQAGYCGVELFNERYTASAGENTDDALIELVPCHCGFSMDCDDTGHGMRLNNKPPVIQINGEASVNVIVGTLDVTLDASSSYDPDEESLPLHFYWKGYNRSNDGQTRLVGIRNAHTSIASVDTANLSAGFYPILLYVSDGHAIRYTTFNVTIFSADE